MHYFVPKRCVESNKIMYRDKATARQAADQSWRERGTELWVYRCEFCGTWHLTHRDPQSSYTYVPFNQQIKPQSTSAKGRYQSLLQYLLISFDIADIATRNLNRRLQKRLAIMRYVIANLFVFLGEYQSPYVDNILR